MTNKFTTGQEVVYIKMGKNNFMGQIVPCSIHFEVNGSGDNLYEVLLQNGQRIKAFEVDLFSKKDAIKFLKKWIDV